MELTDADVDEAGAGDPHALTRVYEALAPRVQRYLWGRGAEDPEGLTHEVFVTVLRRIGTVEGGVEGLRRFVFSVAHARYVDEMRLRIRRPVHVPYDGADDRRTTVGAEAAALERLGADEALGLVSRLKDDQREVVAMRVLGELSLEQTAEVMGRSVGAVKQLQRRGLLALRSMIEEGGSHHG
jgi:RNA polymerase sigma factor (sigma-70 family)